MMISGDFLLGLMFCSLVSVSFLGFQLCGLWFSRKFSPKLGTGLLVPGLVYYKAGSPSKLEGLQVYSLLRVLAAFMASIQRGVSTRLGGGGGGLGHGNKEARGIEILSQWKRFVGEQVTSWGLVHGQKQREAQLRLESGDGPQVGTWSSNRCAL